MSPMGPMGNRNWELPSGKVGRGVAMVWGVLRDATLGSGVPVADHGWVRFGVGGGPILSRPILW